MLKKTTALFLTVVLAAFVFPFCAFAVSEAPPEVVSESYVVMDAATGQVLIEKNMNRREYPASITKVLTVALALQNSALKEKVTVSQNAAWGIEPNSSNIALQPGEVLTVEDLAYATMLPSANDAANALAEHVSGSTEAFAAMMNKKAAELGCTGTNFVNASGLPEDNHYTTAYDMALITKYAMTVPNYMSIFGMKDIYVIPPNAMQKNERRFGTEHMMLVESKYYYEGTLGGKLGWTEEAKHTMVTVVQRGAVKLICVTMKSPQKYDKFKDATMLFDYCFDSFVPISITKDRIKTFDLPNYKDGDSSEDITITGKEDYPLLLHKSINVNDINISYDIPEKYSYAEINPRVSFSVNSDSMYGNLGSYPMDYSVLAADNTLDSGNLKKPWASFGEQILAVLKVLAIMLLGLAVLVLLLGFFAVFMRIINKRRRKSKRRAVHAQHNLMKKAGSNPDNEAFEANNGANAEPRGYAAAHSVATPRGYSSNRSPPYKPPEKRRGR